MSNRLNGLAAYLRAAATELESFDTSVADASLSRQALRDWAREVDSLSAPPASAQETAQGGTFDFCWLVELFEPDGNSMGYYHTGFTDLGGNSRTTKNPHEARRYNKPQAEAAAAKLHHLAGVWRAVEHGFARAALAAQAPAQRDERAAFQAWYEADALGCGSEHSNWFRRDSDGDYEIDHVAHCWTGWQARSAQAGIQISDLVPKASSDAKEAAPVAPGWVLVPVEPTTRQMAAMGPAIRACYSLDGVSGTVKDVYAAALAAAPKGTGEGI